MVGLFEGEETPSCEVCEMGDRDKVTSGKRSHGIGSLGPKMVLYNECNPHQEVINAFINVDLKSEPGAIIVVGTSPKIPGVNWLVGDMCKLGRGHQNGLTAWINNAY